MIAIFGALTSSEPDDKDFSGQDSLDQPQGTVVDQEVFNSDYLSALGSDASDNQIQTRDLIKLIRAAAEDQEIPAVVIDFSVYGFCWADNGNQYSQRTQSTSRLR